MDLAPETTSRSRTGGAVLLLELVLAVLQTPLGLRQKGDLEAFCNWRLLSRPLQEHVDQSHPSMLSSLAKACIEEGALEGLAAASVLAHYGTFATLRKVKELNLDLEELDADATDTLSAFLAICESLERLMIWPAGGLAISDLELCNPALASITIGGFDVQSQAGQGLIAKHLPSLSEVRVNGAFDGDGGPSFWRVAGYPECMSELVVRDLQLDMADLLAGVRRFSQLRKLVLHTVGLRDVDIVTLGLASMPLEELGLCHDPLTDAAVADLHLESNTSLRKLSLVNTRVRDPACLRLDLNRSIQVLDLFRSPLASLELGLAKNTRLHTLWIGDIEEMRLSAAGFHSLSRQLERNVTLKRLSICGLPDCAFGNALSFQEASLAALELDRRNMLISPADLRVLGVDSNRTVERVYVRIDPDHGPAFSTQADVTSFRIVDLRGVENDAWSSERELYDSEFTFEDVRC